MHDRIFTPGPDGTNTIRGTASCQLRCLGPQNQRLALGKPLEQEIRQL